MFLEGRALAKGGKKINGCLAGKFLLVFYCCWPFSKTFLRIQHFLLIHQSGQATLKRILTNEESIVTLWNAKGRESTDFDWNYDEFRKDFELHFILRNA